MNGRMMGIAAGLGLATVGIVAGTWDDAEEGASPAVTHAPAEPAPGAPECRFERQDTAAFSFESTATLDEVPAPRVEDHFQGHLSWVVVEEAQAGRPALLRGALSAVELEQALSQEQVSAVELEDSPFYVRVDTRCRFTGIGFSPRWSGASRRLVSTFLESLEFVLPGDDSTHWSAEQRDGVGVYTAEYRRDEAPGGAARLVRTKPRYQLDDTAQRIGLRVQVLGATAEADFDPERGGWMRRVEGQETLRIHLPGEAPQGFTHRFHLVREDGHFVSVRDSVTPEEADFSDVFESDPTTPSPVDTRLAALDAGAARSRFLAFFGEGGKNAVFPAARFLAGWLRAHPEESALLLTDLRRGAIDETARSAFFLAFELAGTEQSRQVLADALVSRDLSALDRSRAASALADHGEPSRQAADLLLAQARGSDSAMVANVSLLGLGSMAGRTRPGDPLRDELHAALREELVRAAGSNDELAVLDAIGNSGDDAFRTELDERLRTGAPALRGRAAEALGRLSPEVTRPLLVSQLEREPSPGVSTTILRSLSHLAPGAELDLTGAELALAGQKLASASSVEERAGVIEWVGRARGQREARRVLAAHFPREPSVHLQQRIGAFVTPSELREFMR
ncbi:HEAT repeat domain-containing protein [Myxococcus sp. SDU36]|uniref:HEAT repeat domain-containing protein n=1 Tax=Myxococcus sp. SDU36 TaxID=2831967 RepID=UPI00254366D3|nr:HEAT repeat domain-containing protein [Myxococcus sp. SDU36]WIG98006.1 HEAT repeat domain-containing protein [Myxococcus sp. SDU36]